MTKKDELIALLRAKWVGRCPRENEVCLMSACDTLRIDDEPIRDLLDQRYGDDSITDWNDARDRTLGEVLALVEEALP